MTNINNDQSCADFETIIDSVNSSISKLRNNEINKDQFNIIIKEKLDFSFKILTETANNTKEKLESHAEFLKEDIENKIESLKIELDKLKEDLHKDVEQKKKDFLNDLDIDNRIKTFGTLKGLYQKLNNNIYLDDIDLEGLEKNIKIMNNYFQEHLDLKFAMELKISHLFNEIDIGKIIASTNRDIANSTWKFTNRKYLASGSNDNKIIIWDLKEYLPITSLIGHTDSVYCLEQINSILLASGSRDKTIKLWNLNNYECIQTLGPLNDIIICLKLINNNILASGCSDHNIYLWNLKDYSCMQIINGHNNIVVCLEVIHSTLFCSGSRDCLICFWKLNTDSQKFEIFHFLKEEHSIDDLKLINPLTLACCSSNQKIKLLNLKDFSFIKILEGHTESVNCLALINDILLISSGDDYTIKIWSLESGNSIGSIRVSKETKGINCLERIDLDFFATGSTDRIVKIWDLKTKSCIKTLEDHTHSVLCLKLIE